MISQFVRLKITLTKNLFRTSAGYGFILFVFFAGTVSVVATAMLWRADHDMLPVLGPIVGSALGVGWILGPIFYGSSDESIDTTKLSLFPISGHQATIGIAIAGFLSPGPIAAIGPLTVFVVRSPGASKIVAGVAAITALLLPVAASKLALTALGNAARQRGRRDWATVGAGLGAATLAIAMQALVLIGPRLDGERLRPLADVLRWTPLGWAGDALGRSTEGQLLVPVVEVALSAGLLAGVIGLWSSTLQRALTETPGHAAGDERGRHLLGSSSLWSAHPYGPIVAKELRYLRRDPRYRIQIVSQLVVLFVGGAPFVRAVIDKDPAAVLVGCVPALTTGITGTNLLGPDGRALWAEVLALDSLDRLLRGRALAFATVGFIGAVVVTLATAIYTGGWNYVPAALGAAVGFGFLGSGVGSVVSVISPSPYPEASSPNPFSSSSPGRGLVAALFTFSGVLAGLVLAAPILVGLGRTQSAPLWIVVTGLASPVYGLGMWWLTTGFASRTADARAPELVQVFAAGP